MGGNDNVSALFRIVKTYFLSPIGTSCHFARRRKQITVFASNAKQSPGRVGYRKAYTFLLKSWDISLALNMT